MNNKKLRNHFVQQNDCVLQEEFLDGNDGERREDEGDGGGETGGSPVVAFLRAVGAFSPALPKPFVVDGLTFIAGYRLANSYTIKTMPVLTHIPKWTRRVQRRFIAEQ